MRVVLGLLLALPIAVYAAITLSAADPRSPSPVTPVILPSGDQVGEQGKQGKPTERDDDRRDDQRDDQRDRQDDRRDRQDDRRDDRDDADDTDDDEVEVVTPRPTNVDDDDEGDDDREDDDDGGDD